LAIIDGRVFGEGFDMKIMVVVLLGMKIKGERN
jgi:hypothetical protein